MCAAESLFAPHLRSPRGSSRWVWALRERRERQCVDEELKQELVGGRHYRGVEDRLFTKAFRHELSAMGGFYAADLYSSSWVVGGAYTFHFSEDLGLEASVEFMRFQSAVTDAYERRYPQIQVIDNPDKPGRLYFGHLVWSFAYGKLRWMGDGISRFDFNLAFGAGVTDDSDLARRDGQRRPRDEVLLRQVVRRAVRRTRPRAARGAGGRRAPGERLRHNPRRQRVHPIRRVKALGDRPGSGAPSSYAEDSPARGRDARGGDRARDAGARPAARAIRQGAARSRGPPPPTHPADDRSPPAAGASSAAPAPASSNDTGPVPPPAPDSADGGKLSPLNPAANEFSDAGVPPPSLDYDRLLADIGALRARVAAVSDTLFHSRIAIALEASGDHGRIAGLSVSLDDGVVWTSPASFRPEDPTTVYEHAVAPGHHAVTVDVERRDDRNDTFRSAQRSRFMVDVPADEKLAVEVKLWDDSSMGGDFRPTNRASTILRVRVRANAQPLPR